MLYSKRTITAIILWLLVVLWMVLIFCLSAQNAAESSSLSGGLVEKIARMISPGFENLTAEQQASLVEGYQHAARKAAHLGAYMVLGALSMSALLRHSIKASTRFIYAIAISAGYAVTDEIHQLFVPGRSAQLTDLIIDTCGALIGICLILLIRRLFVRSKRRSGSKLT